MSAQEAKRLEQKKYYDEISAAAAAAPISRDRVPLRNGSANAWAVAAPSGGGGGGRGGPADAWEGNGTGLQIGAPSPYSRQGSTGRRSGAADADAYDARAKKVEQQREYAQQLKADASTAPLATGRSQSTGAAHRRRNTYGDGDGAGPGASRGGLFDGMSDGDAAAAKKRASQREYYRQLQEIDSQRARAPGAGDGGGYGGPPAAGPSSASGTSRTSLYRLQQQQKEAEQQSLSNHTRYKGESPLTARQVLHYMHNVYSVCAPGPTQQAPHLTPLSPPPRMHIHPHVYHHHCTHRGTAARGVVR